MNKEIIRINGLTIVEDEKGNKKQVDNCDNLGEILLQENIVEKLENKQKEAESEKNKHEVAVNERKSNLAVSTVASIFLTILLPLAMNLLLEALGVSSVILGNFGNISLGDLVSLFTLFNTSLCSFTFLGLEKSSIKELENELRANENLYEYVTGELFKQKQYLEKLNNEKKLIQTCDKEEFTTTKVNDEDKLNNLNYYLDLYYECGYNYNHYLKYYNNGKLREKLMKDFTEEEIEIYENYYKTSEQIENEKKLALINKK